MYNNFKTKGATMKNSISMISIICLLTCGSMYQAQASSYGKYLETMLCGLVKSGAGDKILAAGQSGLIGGTVSSIVLAATQPKFVEKFGIRLRDKGFLRKIAALGILALGGAAACGSSSFLGSTCYHISDKAGTPFTVVTLAVAGAGVVLGLSLNDSDTK